MLVHQIGVTYVIFFLRRRDLAAAEEPLTFIENEASNLFFHSEHPGDATLLFKDLHSQRWVDIGKGKRRSSSSKVLWTFTYQSNEMRFEIAFCRQ